MTHLRSFNEPAPAFELSSPYDVAFEFRDGAYRLILSRALFDQAAGDTLARHFTEVIEQLVDSPSSPVM